MLKTRVAAERDHVYHLYVVIAERRDELQRFLTSRNVQTLIHYPIPVDLQPCYRNLEKGPGSFPVAERLAGSLLSLPMFPHITKEQIRYVCDSLKALI